MWAVSYLAAGYMGRHGTPKVREDCGPQGVDTACSLADPYLLDALLPDPAKLLADWRPLETLDLQSPQERSSPAKQEDMEKSPLFGFAPEDSFLQGLVPESIRSADEAECFPFMPHSERMTSLARMLGTGSGEDEEEQEAEFTEPPADPKIVEARLKRILQSFLREGNLNGGAGIDTMEFRPSDAKKGEFDRIPF